MKAGVVTPGRKDSARLVEMAAPSSGRGEVLVSLLAVGIDGTDMEINRGQYGELAIGHDFLILGHEALGTVENPGTSTFSKGELVVPLVRRPDGCVNCRNGQSDMCIEGNYRECGIRGARGFLREYQSKPSPENKSNSEIQRG